MTLKKTLLSAVVVSLLSISGADAQDKNEKRPIKERNKVVVNPQKQKPPQNNNSNDQQNDQQKDKRGDKKGKQK